MNNAENRSQDPSRKAGNRKVRNGARGITAAAAIALAAACAPAPSEAPEPAPRMTIETTSTTQKPEVTTTTTPEVKNTEALNEQMQTSAEGFATQIIGEYNKVKSPANFVFDETRDGTAAVNVLYTADTLVAGAYGEYGMVAVVKRDEKGNFDPSSVERIDIFENVNVTGKPVAQDEGDRTNLYHFTLDKSPTTGLWSGNVTIQSKGSEVSQIRFGADRPFEFVDIASVSPMTPDNYAAVEGQASTILNWAVEGAPVNLAPGISLKD